jgi:hypothetical protein
MLRLEYEPQGFVENIGDAAGFVTRRVEGDLERFKEYIERRGQETGALARYHQGTLTNNSQVLT